MFWFYWTRRWWAVPLCYRHQASVVHRPASLHLPRYKMSKQYIKLFTLYSKKWAPSSANLFKKYVLIRSKIRLNHTLCSDLTKPDPSNPFGHYVAAIWTTSGSTLSSKISLVPGATADGGGRSSSSMHRLPLASRPPGPHRAAAAAHRAPQRTTTACCGRLKQEATPSFASLAVAASAAAERAATPLLAAAALLLSAASPGFLASTPSG